MIKELEHAEYNVKNKSRRHEPFIACYSLISIHCIDRSFEGITIMYKTIVSAMHAYVMTMHVSKASEIDRVIFTARWRVK